MKQCNLCGGLIATEDGERIAGTICECGSRAAPCSALVECVKMFRTTDGELYYSKDTAVRHQQDIEDAKEATRMLEGGYSVGEILRAFGRPLCDEVLDRVTKDSKLVISHWQCRDQPGYQPIRFEPGWGIFVYGDAGSWSGPYGGTMSAKNLATYAMDRNSIHPQNVQSEGARR